MKSWYYVGARIEAHHLVFVPLRQYREVERWEAASLEEFVQLRRVLIVGRR